MSVHTARTGKLTKHVGIYKDKKCVVVLQLPEDPTKAHIIDTEALPDQYHQGLMDIVQSPEGQQAHYLGEVLHRRMMPDGRRALQTFYENGHITMVPTDQVMLTPYPNQRIPLSEYYGQFTDPLADVQSGPTTRQEQELEAIRVEEQRKMDAGLHNQHQQNLTGDKTEESQAIAKGLLAEAELLEAEAKKKRALAAQYAGAKKKTELKVVTSDPFVDPVTGKSYKSESALKGAITKREKKQASK